MKKMALISGIVFVLFLFSSHGLQAQGIYRYGLGIENDDYGLNLTQEQMEQIDRLVLELEKELVPLIAKLRSHYVVLDELEAQRNPDPTRINNVWDVIYRLEEDLQNKEILHENKIRDLLTEEQRAVFDSYYAYGTNPYGRGGFGRGYFVPRFRGFRGGDYGYRGYGYGVGTGGIGRGRGAGGLGRGYISYRSGSVRGYAGRLGFGIGRFLSGIRYGKGSRGAGLCRWYRRIYNRVGWNKNR